MVSVAWDVFAVSETQLHWSNALASTRMVILWLPRHSAYDGFLSWKGTIANFMMRRTRQDRLRALPPAAVY